MSTITTLNSSDTGPVSRGVINTNFTNLNTDKVETSVISTDGTLATNSDAKLPTEKAVKTYVDAQYGITVETTAGVTHSLTTTAGQVVCVFAKGMCDYTGASTVISLKYNGVAKDTLSVSELDSSGFPFSLMYIETPGAGTYNITVDMTNSGALSEVVILVQIIG